LEQQLTFFLALAVGLIFGALAVWLMLRADTKNAYGRAYTQAKTEFGTEISKLTERLSGKDARIEDLLKDQDQVKAELEKQRRQSVEFQGAKAELEARLAEQAKMSEEKLAVVDQAQKQLTDTFQALSATALKSNNEAFLQLAQSALDKYQEGARTDLASRQKAIEEVLKPVRDSLGKVDMSIEAMGKDHAGISKQVELLHEAQGILRSETSNLVSALRTPTVRGRWGEIQLRRVVEMAGMVAYCDFQEQASVDTDAGRLRPDLLVRLPNKRNVVVDAKVSLKAYLEAMDTSSEEERVAKLKEHASQIRSHLQKLGSKSYWDQCGAAPEFVVAFLPGEAFFSAALEQDPGLIEYGVDNKVILATPTTLIALLKSVAYGWRQEKLTENAQEISDLGKTLYDRLCTFTQHLETMRINLQRTVDGYNRAVGSLESRVLVSARRFQQLGAAADRDVPTLEPVDNFPRSLQAVERAVSAGELETPLADEEAQPAEPEALSTEPETPEFFEPEPPPVDLAALLAPPETPEFLEPDSSEPTEPPAEPEEESYERLSTEPEATAEEEPPTPSNETDDDSGEDELPTDAGQIELSEDVSLPLVDDEEPEDVEQAEEDLEAAELESEPVAPADAEPEPEPVEVAQSEESEEAPEPAEAEPEEQPDPPSGEAGAEPVTIHEKVLAQSDRINYLSFVKAM
jgi:DNA recombination protein RmuC